MELVDNEEERQFYRDIHEILETAEGKRETAFKAFMDKMTVAEKSIKENGFYSEEEVEEELAKV